jgi:predicted XRE-type DNA-binding protein
LGKKRYGELLERRKQCERQKAMMIALTGYILERKITQSRAARIMGVSQPRISDMVTAAGPKKVDVDLDQLK